MKWDYIVEVYEIKTGDVVFALEVVDGYCDPAAKEKHDSYLYGPDAALYARQIIEKFGGY